MIEMFGGKTSCDNNLSFSSKCVEKCGHFCVDFCFIHTAASLLNNIF